MEKLRLFQLFVTLVIASQGIFYLLGLAEAMGNVSIATFAESRKNIDAVIANRLRILYYAALLSGLVILYLYRKEIQGHVFLCTLVAILLIIADIVMALRGSIPINAAFNQYPVANLDWPALQADWIRLIYYRGICSSIALFALLFSWK